ncbi:MAG: choice-of-anchor D domain-containing protein [Steroidobacteraceae bacterium]
MTELKVAILAAVFCAVAACGGHGSPPSPALDANPTAVSFANQQVGTTSVPTVVTVSNSGSANLTISAVQVTGTNSGSFAETNNCATVAPGASCSISLTFSPPSANPLSATLTVVSNAASSSSPIALGGQGVVTATWTTLLNAPPEGLRLCLLLTDGSVMCQATQNWYRLTPSLTGSYIEGTWSLYTSLPASYIPDAYASAVLADGRLAIIGGEYTLMNGSFNFTLSNMGQIFDPATQLWQPLQAPAATGSPNHWQCIGDAPASVLADGRWVIGSKLYQDVAALDPKTLTWSTISAPGKIDTVNSEEGWTLLADGSVLTLDVSSAPFSERLVLAPGATTGAWQSAGQTPQDLHTPSSATQALNAPGCPPYNPPGEMGPALLMPNGNVFAVGADGLTAIYAPGGGTWSVGPAVPGGLNVQDGPAAMLPSGHVLFGASPGATDPGLQYFEFDGAQLAAAPPPENAPSDATESTSLLPLPTGQVLFVDLSTTVQIYSPALSPTYDPAWAPTITSAPTDITAGTTYQISGTQFNGLTQASAYGDESQNATNYPLVRITNRSTGHVFYARTHDHSTMGVATGSAIVSTYFDVPTMIESGAGTLQVVANGIPSAAIDVNVSGGT